MRHLQILIGICFLAFTSCSDKLQYDVYVKNSTGEEINIDFKSINDRQGPVENSIVLKDGEQKRIISTKDIKWSEKRVMATADQCHQVADYVTARIGNKESSLKWCDDKIEFSEEDIGQGTFTIVYTKSDF